jgi:hypothetical protein
MIFAAVIPSYRYEVRVEDRDVSVADMGTLIVPAVPEYLPVEKKVEVPPLEPIIEPILPVVPQQYSYEPVYPASLQPYTPAYSVSPYPVAVASASSKIWILVFAAFLLLA